MPKLSIYLSDATVRRLGNPENVSARVAQMIDGYVEIAQRSRPDLSREEWLALCSAVDPVALKDRPGEVARYLWAEIAQSQVRPPKPCDLKALAEKLQVLSPAQTAAVIEVLLRFVAQKTSLALDRRLDRALAD